MPFLRFFAKMTANEPLRGYAITFVIAFPLVLMADINFVSPIVTNFFLISCASREPEGVAAMTRLTALSLSAWFLLRLLFCSCSCVPHAFMFHRCADQLFVLRSVTFPSSWVAPVVQVCCAVLCAVGCAVVLCIAVCSKRRPLTASRSDAGAAAAQVL